MTGGDRVNIIEACPAWPNSLLLAGPVPKRDLPYPASVVRSIDIYLRWFSVVGIRTKQPRPSFFGRTGWPRVSFVRPGAEGRGRAYRRRAVESRLEAREVGVRVGGG